MKAILLLAVVVTCNVFLVTLSASIRLKQAQTFIAKCSLLATVTIASSPALGLSLENGHKVFVQNCVGCHANGGNVLPFAQSKTLYSEALKKNGYSDSQSIENLVSHGSGAMPAFGSFTSPKGNLMPAKLSSDDIADVVQYLLQRAAENWL